MSSPTTTTTATKRGISLHVTITVSPQNATEFLRLAHPTFELLAAEPLNLFFEVFHSADQPGVFRLVENWAMTREEFVNNQLTKEYYKPYEEVTKPLWIEERTGAFFDLLGKEWTSQKEGNVL